MPNRTRKFKKLAVLNRRIVRLSSELETLQFMQDRLARDLAPGPVQEPSTPLRRSRRQSRGGGEAGSGGKDD